MRIINIILISLLSSSIVYAQSSSTSPGIILSEEGSSVGKIKKLDCVGSSITCTASGGTGTLTDSGGGGGSSAYDDITAPDANSTINFGSFTNTWTSALGDANFFTIDGSTGDIIFQGDGDMSIDGSLTGDVIGNVTGNADTATALAANGSNCSAGSGAGGVDASGAAEDCTDYLENVVEDTTPQLGGELDAQGNNIIDLADVTFRTGASGGTIRTGTSAADKFQIQAYDTNDTMYRTIMEADAGTEPIMQLFTDLFHFENSSDATKILDIDLATATTSTTTTLDVNSTVDRTLSLPDETGTLCSTGSVCTGYESETHASEHQDAGADEVAVTGGMMNADFGDYTCDGTATGCTLDASVVSDNEIDYTTVTLADFTDDVGYEEETHASEHNVGGNDAITVYLDDVQDPDANSSYSFGSLTNIWTSTLTDANFFTIDGASGDFTVQGDGDVDIDGTLNVDNDITFGSGSELLIESGANAFCAVVAPLACASFTTTGGGAYEWSDGSGNQVAYIQASDGVLFTDTGIDATGATSLTYGSADVTTHSIVSDGGTVTVDGDVSITDDLSLILGTDSDMQISYDELTDNRLEITDGTNTLAHLTDSGTYGTFSSGVLEASNDSADSNFNSFVDGNLNSAISVYDTTGGQTFTTGTILLNMDTTQKNTDSGVYTLSADEVDVARTDTYLITFDASTNISSGTSRSVSKCWLEQNSSEVAGTRCYMYNRNNTAGHNSCTATTIMDLTSGDNMRVRCNRVTGSDTINTIADGSRLTIIRLPS